jgi:hypothetical protein
MYVQMNAGSCRVTIDSENKCSYIIVAVLIRDVWNVMVCKGSSLCFFVH